MTQDEISTIAWYVVAIVSGVVFFIACASQDWLLALLAGFCELVSFHLARSYEKFVHEDRERN